MVTVAGSEGDFGVLAGHMPLISTLRPASSTSGAAAESGGSFASSSWAASPRANPSKLTVLAEEALPMTSVDAATLEARGSKNTEEDLVLAKK